MGFEPAMIQRLVRAVLAQVRTVGSEPRRCEGDISADTVQTGSSLVSMIHGDQLPLLASSPPADSSKPEVELLHRLMRISNGWWRVSGLSSGRSGNVSGEVSRLSAYQRVGPL